MTQFETKD